MIEIQENVYASASQPSKKFIPIITAICCVISVVLFVGVNLEDTSYSWNTLRKWGSPGMDDVFKGDYWGLITSNFFHIDLWHIAFNLYWLWIFGRAIEFERGRRFYVLLILSSALVSSLSQISISEGMGIGLSGIVYAFFGFLLQKSKTEGGYKKYLNKATINLFIFWLFFCVFLTQTKMLDVANGAHFGGLAWGMLLGYISRYGAVKQYMVGVPILLLLGSAIFFSPFSTSWLTYQAHKLHSAQQVDEAERLYRKILDRDPDDSNAKENLQILEIHKLQTKAFDLQANKKYEEARQVYQEILKIDPKNAWALESISDLPKQ